MKIGDVIELYPVTLLHKGVPARATITDTGFVVPPQTPDTLALRIEDPPDWYRRMLQRRGIFSGGGETVMFLFRDHKRNWTDQQTFEHFTILEAAA